MSEARCATCGTPLIPGTGFCRQCGAPAVPELEQPTALLDQNTDQTPDHSADGTTKRLDLRPTNPYHEGVGDDRSEVTDAPSGPPRRLLFFGVLVVAIVACVSIAGVVRSVLKTQPAPQAIHVDRSMIYPNSRVVLDLGDTGGAVLQLSTTDTLDKVQAWYMAQMKPDKVLQATMNMSIMRKDRMTATIVVENNLTSIVIKQAAP